jgi:hypothetical protein
MDMPKIRLYPDSGNMAGKTAVWKWEIFLDSKKIAGLPRKCIHQNECWQFVESAGIGEGRILPQG